jgi:hypothetical protein
MMKKKKKERKKVSHDFLGSCRFDKESVDERGRIEQVHFSGGLGDWVGVGGPNFLFHTGGERVSESHG